MATEIITFNHFCCRAHSILQTEGVSMASVISPAMSVFDCFELEVHYEGEPCV